MNSFVWMDLGVSNLERAVRFYSAVMAIELKVEEYQGFRFAVFSHRNGEVAGCLVPKAEFQPIPASTTIYLNVSGRIQQALSEVEKHGGKIIETLHSIGPHGQRALILDSEGNHMALHSE